MAACKQAYTLPQCSPAQAKGLVQTSPACISTSARSQPKKLDPQLLSEVLCRFVTVTLATPTHYRAPIVRPSDQRALLPSTLICTRQLNGTSSTDQALSIASCNCIHASPCVVDGIGMLIWAIKCLYEHYELDPLDYVVEVDVSSHEVTPTSSPSQPQYEGPPLSSYQLPSYPPPRGLPPPSSHLPPPLNLEACPHQTLL